MNNRLIYLDEPELFFAHNHTTHDPKEGLTVFGPYEPISRDKINAGVIGTKTGISLYKDFIDTLQRPLYSQGIARPAFPGFSAVFDLEWPSLPTVTRELDEAQLHACLSVSGLKERTYRLVNLYLNELKRVQEEEDATIDIWYIIVPRRVWRECRSKSRNSPGLQADIESVKRYVEGQATLFSHINEQYDELSKILDLHSDFHHQLKARLLQERVLVPVQIVVEPTLEFKDKYHNWKYKDKIRTHLAWTQSTTVYYKLGSLPWKLADIRKGVCYVGLVFKKYQRLTGEGYACSAAQMFLDSGDGTVFKGNIGPWQSKSKTEFHLDAKSAKDLIVLAMESYFAKRGKYPEELFIHGRASFGDDEWNGFQDGVQHLHAATRLTGIVIRESDKLKLFRDVIGKDSLYGNLRGLANVVDEQEGSLWTRGFIPSIATSNSMEIPNPLRIRIDRGEADIIQVLRDILSLTKLNYNACIYGDGLPVTLRFSDLIGNILTAVPSVENKVLPFKYYI